MPAGPARLIVISAAAAVPLGCQQRTEPVAMDGHVQYTDVVVDASCGQCRLDLPGSGCDLAVRIDGMSYYVDGSGIDEHGDAHAADGLCNAVRRARVSGSLEDGRFVATRFELLPAGAE